MATWGCLPNDVLVFAKKRDSFCGMKNRYSANLIPVIFVFTFVYSIILYAFSKVIEGNILVFNCMTKMSCFRSDRGVIGENVLYHCLWTFEYE